MNSRTCLALLALGSLGACNTVYESSGSADAGLGEAAKYNIAVQTIDPDPGPSVQPLYGAPVLN